MKHLLLPLAIASLGVVVYHLGQKSLPACVNPMLLLMAVYAAAFVMAALAVPLFRAQGAPLALSQFLNWPVLLVALGVLGIELGFLLFYRAGGPMQWAGIAVNGIAAILLLPVALLAFKEHFSPGRTLGVLLTLTGLALMTRR